MRTCKENKTQKEGAIGDFERETFSSATRGNTSTLHYGISQLELGLIFINPTNLIGLYPKLEIRGKRYCRHPPKYE